jgi:hypothetical protein
MASLKTCATIPKHFQKFGLVCPADLRLMLMQEHHRLIKRANTSSGDQLDKPTQIFENALGLLRKSLMKPFMKALLYIVLDLEPLSSRP